METITINLTEIITDRRCQSRAGIHLALVQEYVDHLRDGVDLPPMATIRTDAGYVLYDGFHRIQAYRRAGVAQVEVMSEPGDVWDAIERSCRVNTTHGKRRDPEDTKRAVETILTVMRHRGEKWSNVEIAEKCALSDRRVGQIINETPSLKDFKDTDTPTTVTRGGSTYPMDTTKIGRRRAPNIDAPADDDEEDAEQTERNILDVVDAHGASDEKEGILRTAFIAQYSTVVDAVMIKLVPLDPDITASFVGNRHGTDRFIEQTRDWLDRFEAARKRAGTIHELRRKDMTS